jgi:hypothetical protein
MTDRAIQLGWTITAGVGLFVATVVGLAVQMRDGRDPRLGTAPTVAVVRPPARSRPVLVKRIVRHVIDDTIVVEPAQSPTPVAPVVVSSGAPVVVGSAPPPVVAAPAPAPIVTRTS